MSKYLTVFTISWQNEFIYRLNFILWRFRGVLRFLMVYFLWKGIFLSNNSVFGYSQNEMFAYVFLALIINTLVLSAPSNMHIGEEIANGDLSNYLVKPINYLGFWFTRDLSSKVLNLFFGVFEIGILWLVLQPIIKLTQNPLSYLAFFILAIFAILIYYFLNICSKSTSFWRPEDTWGISFFIMILVETLAGLIFPLDILPQFLKVVLQFTPFPYLVYFPAAIVLGKITGWEILRIILQSLLWTILMFFIARFIWQKGLKVYGAEGR